MYDIYTSPLPKILYVVTNLIITASYYFAPLGGVLCLIPRRCEHVNVWSAMVDLEFWTYATSCLCAFPSSKVLHISWRHTFLRNYIPQMNLPNSHVRLRLVGFALHEALDAPPPRYSHHQFLKLTTNQPNLYGRCPTILLAFNWTASQQVALIEK